MDHSTDLRRTIRDLASYAISKKYAVQGSRARTLDPLESPHITFPKGGFGSEKYFFEVVENEGQTFARIRVLPATMEAISAIYPCVKKAQWGYDDVEFAEVPLNGEVPTDYIKERINDSYDIVWKSLDECELSFVERACASYDERNTLERLIEEYGLNEQRDAIFKIARPAVLLRTRAAKECDLAIGASKIGGCPELPTETSWPTYKDGRPLAFLAQLDLAEIAKVGSPFANLPSSGLLSLFTVWGWITPDDTCPNTPSDDTWKDQRNGGWTKVIYTPSGTTLRRMEKPKDLFDFRPAAIEPIPILSLTNCCHYEPTVLEMNWSDETMDRFDSMDMCHRALQMGHWLGDYGTFASHHMLGGFGMFNSHIPDELMENPGTMFMQIGSDDYTDMLWLDGASLIFYADTSLLRQGHVEIIWGTCS